MPAIVHSTDPVSYLLCQPPRAKQPGAVVLKDADLSAKPLRTCDLPLSYSQPAIITFPDGAGSLMALAWDLAAGWQQVVKWSEELVASILP